MAVSRASFEKIPVHLITSIPSIETFNNIQNKKFRHFKILNDIMIILYLKQKLLILNIKKLKTILFQETYK